MRYIYNLISLILFIFVLGFAFKNAEPVQIRYYLGFVWEAPLSLVLLATFALGLLLGLIACISPLIKQRRKLLAIQRELKSLSTNTATNSSVVNTSSNSKP